MAPPALLATQRRHLERAGLLLGLETPDRMAERVRAVLDLEGLIHEEIRADITRSLRDRGQAVMRVLLALDAGRDDRLLAAGHEVGLWGCPFRIDPQTGRRHRLPWRDPPTNFALSPWSRAS